jgi:acetylornithine deacetylase/succinyl-diaminopimelate desuccinylase-like protein
MWAATRRGHFARLRRTYSLSRAASFGLLAMALSWAQARAADLDWDAIGRETAQLLSQYIQVDTSNPPGNETAAAQLLAKRFQQEGIEHELLESAPGRGIVLARLKGSGRARPLVLLNHLDVVPADPSVWKVPPFSGEIRDGYVWGRGAMDCKGIGAVYAMSMIVLKRTGVTLARDLVFLGTADEETGGQMGAGWFAENALERLDNAEFVLNEGGHIRKRPDGGRAYEVAVSEKTPCWIRLTATGEAGHGSAPRPETAVTRLIRALERIRTYRPEIRVVPEVAAYYRAVAETLDGPLRDRYRDLASALLDPAFREEFLGNRRNAALVRNTIAPTVLTASNKTNVIPAMASAEVDCRLLPDEKPERFLAAIREVVQDPNVEVEKILSFPPSSSSTETALFRAIRTVAAQERLGVVPSVLTGFTDSHYFREKGIASYGFVPFDFDEEDESRVHGIDERISIANLGAGVRRLVAILKSLEAE